MRSFECGSGSKRKRKRRWFSFWYDFVSLCGVCECVRARECVFDNRVGIGESSAASKIESVYISIDEI